MDSAVCFTITYPQSSAVRLTTIHWIAIYLLNKSLSALIQLGPDLYKAVLLRVFYFSAPRTLGDLIRSIIFQNIDTFLRINEFEISTKVFQCF